MAEASGVDVAAVVEHIEQAEESGESTESVEELIEESAEEAVEEAGVQEDAHVDAHWETEESFGNGWENVEIETSTEDDCEVFLARTKMTA